MDPVRASAPKSSERRAQQDTWRKRTGIEPAGTASPRSPSDLKSEPGTSAGNASGTDANADPVT